MNLSERKTRTVEQEEKIGRRTSIIDERRDTRAPVLEVNANLRDSRRGDVGGAQALMRTLGIVGQGLSDFQNYAMNKHISDEQDNIARGLADHGTGNVDAEMMEKSLGYRNAVTKGRTVTAFSQASREFSEELEEVIEKQTSPDLGARKAEVEQMLEGFYTDFARDPETGELREFLQSPGAMRYLGEAIQASREGAVQNAMTRIEERFNREALSHYSANITNQALDTGTVDLTQSLSLVPDSVTDEQIAETTMVAVVNAAEALRAEGRYEESTALLASIRGRFDTPANAGEATSAPTGMGDVQSLRMPVQGTVTSEFGEGRSSGTHNGVDIAVPVGTPVVAPMGGEVVRAWDADKGGVSLKVKYDDGTVAGFAHLSEQLVKEGRFEAGAQLALTGNTGKSTGPHLHYTLTRDGKKINPLEADFGPVSVDPNETAAAPAARLSDPNADPITRMEQSGTFEPIPGLEGITFTPQQQARIDAIYRQSTGQMRQEWEAANNERQSQNASNLALGLFGMGGRVTTPQDIQTAWENGEIGDDAVMTLIRLQEGRSDRQEAQAERIESRAERDERRRIDRQTEAAGESIIGQMIRGELTPAQSRQVGIQFAGRAVDPKVGAGVLSAVNSAANAYESTIQNSEPVRTAMTAWREAAEDADTEVKALDIPPFRRKVARDALIDIFDRAQGRLLRRVMDGEDPEKARNAVEDWVAKQQVALVKQLTPTQPQY